MLNLRSARALASYWTGSALRELRALAGYGCPILMYHRIVPRKEAGRSLQAGMVVEPDTFDLQLRFLRQHFEIVSLDDVVFALENEIGRQRRMPLCAITFDDGWYDFYQYAYPVLCAHRAPATVFLATSFIGTDRWFWTDRCRQLLDRVIGRRDSYSSSKVFRELGLDSILNSPASVETRSEVAISRLKVLGRDTVEVVLTEMAGLLGEEACFPGRAFLNWEEVAEMHASGLIEFGSHTVGHCSLTSLPEADADTELKASRTVLIDKGLATGDSCQFCYPYGAYSERLMESVRGSGYQSAVTTRGGWNQWGEDLYALKRIGVHQDVGATKSLLGFLIAGH